MRNNRLKVVDEYHHNKFLAGAYKRPTKLQMFYWECKGLIWLAAALLLCIVGLTVILFQYGL